MKTWTLGAFALASLGLTACLPSGGDGGGGEVVLIQDDSGDPGDTGPGGPGGEDAGSPDTGPSTAGDAGADAREDTGGGPPPGCVAEGFEAASAEASQGSSRLSYTGTRPDGAKRDLLYVYIEEGAVEPGTYPFEAVPFADCTTCLVVQTGCQDGLCEAAYMARSGSLEVTAAGPRFEARVRDLRLDPVVINEEGTTVLQGDAYCMIEPTLLEAELEVDPCGGWADPTFVDTNCGPAQLAVTWDVAGAAAELDRVESIEWDFGDGESARSFSSTTERHVYAKGDWQAEVRVVGFIENTRITIRTPEAIRAY